MGCCGQKRKEWSQKIYNSSTEAETIDSGNMQEHQLRVFEYTGKRSMKIKGIVTGNIYYFRYPDHTIEVPYEDSFAMMAETDLKAHAKLDNHSKK
jgi:hypothetical protein